MERKFVESQSVLPKAIVPLGSSNATTKGMTANYQGQTTNEVLVEAQMGNVFSRQQEFSTINRHLNKLMFNTTQLKTPLALLHEFSTTLGGGVKEEMVDIGTDHEHKYKCALQLRVCDKLYEASGIANTKKDAKQAAAKIILLQVGFLESRMAYNFTPNLPPPKPTNVAQRKRWDPETDGNPIGDLNTLCTKIKFATPIYEDISRELETPGLFQIRCRLNENTTEVGAGPTKKHAKRIAASKVLERMLKAVDIDEAEANKMLFTEGECDELCRKLVAFSILNKDPVHGSSSTTSTDVSTTNSQNSIDIVSDSTSSKPVTEIMKGIRSLAGVNIEKLMLLTTHELQQCDHARVLAEVASEQQLRILYQDFTPYLDDSEYKSVLTFVIGGTRHIFIGSGQNQFAARKPAAFQALEYLRLAARL